MTGDTLKALLGRPPEVVASAPGRVNLIGEHTDYNGGLALPFAIDRRARVGLARRPDARITVQSAQMPGAPVTVDVGDTPRADRHGYAAYPLAAIAVLRETGVTVPGLDVAIDSDVPVGAGLASSAALTCATLLAAAGLTGVPVGGPELARLAHRAETGYVGVPCGLLDQLTAFTAVPGHVLLFDASGPSVRPIPFRDDSLALLVIDTGVRHDLTDGGYAARRRACEAAARRLGVTRLSKVRLDDLDQAVRTLADAPEQAAAVRHVVTENHRVRLAVQAIERGTPQQLGALLNASHASLRDDYRVSVDEADRIVDAARAAGAWGARITGGGFGGSVLALAPATRVAAIVAAVAATGSGSAVIPVRPAAPARIEFCGNGSGMAASP